MDLPIGPTNLSSTAAATNPQPLHLHHHTHLQQQHLNHQDSRATAPNNVTTNYNALIANNIPLQQLLNRHTTSDCGLAFAATVLAFQQSQLQQAHLQHHQQRQQPPASHMPAVNLSTGATPPAQQAATQQQQQPTPPATTIASSTQPQQQPSSNFPNTAQQSSAQTRMAQAAAVAAAAAAAAVAPLQAYQNPASYNIYPIQQQQQQATTNQQTPNQPPVPQQQQPQPQQQQQLQTTPTATSTTTVPQIPPFYPFTHWEQALALLAQPEINNHVSNNFYHILNLYLQNSLRTDPHHTHHHHHTPYHYHHHLHGSHHHHHHHYGPHGQNNGQDDGMLTINESKPRGLNRAEIDSLPPYIQMNEKDSRTCVICLSRFEPKSKIRPLPCNHAFHAKCVDKWLRANRTCPICRRDALKTHVAKIKRI